MVKKRVQEALRKLGSGEFTREQFEAELRSILAEVDPEEMEEAARFIADVRSAAGEEDKEENSEDEVGSAEDEDKKEENKAKRSVAEERRRAAEISAVCARFGVFSTETSRFINDGTPLQHPELKRFALPTFESNPQPTFQFRMLCFPDQ